MSEGHISHIASPKCLDTHCRDPCGAPLVDCGEGGVKVSKQKPEHAVPKRCESTGDSEHRRFAGSGCSHDRDELSSVHREVNASDRSDRSDRSFSLSLVHRDAIELEQELLVHLLATFAGRPRLGTSVLRGNGAACPAAEARASRASEWSSQRTSASAWKMSKSTTSSQARSSEFSGSPDAFLVVVSS
jgi:hypothetical protein